MSGRGGARPGAGPKRRGRRTARLSVSLHQHEKEAVERIFADELGQKPSEAILGLVQGKWRIVRCTQPTSNHGEKT